MLSRYLIIFALLTHLLFSAHLPAQTINKPLVSVQLHSVKNALINDFKGTLTALANTGIDGVEFAGKFGAFHDDPAALKTYLDSLGLKASGAHVSLKQLHGTNFDTTVDFYKALGVKTLIIPVDKRVDKPDKISQLTKELTLISHQLNGKSMTLAYHNHAREFTPFNDSTFWDYLAQNTPENMALQLDVGWANFAGVNAVNYVKRYPNRTLTTHIKIRTTKDKKLWDKIEDNVAIVIGEDPYNWQALINTMIDVGGTQWLVVEQEETHVGESRLQTLTDSIYGLQKILKHL